MQNSILFKVPGKPSTSPIVILTGPALEAQYSTSIGARLFQALAVAVWRVRVFMRWMEITAMSAPNPMYIGNKKGGRNARI